MPFLSFLNRLLFLLLMLAGLAGLAACQSARPNYVYVPPVQQQATANITEANSPEAEATRPRRPLWSSQTTDADAADAQPLEAIGTDLPAETATEADPETPRTLFGRLGTRRAAPRPPQDPDRANTQELEAIGTHSQTETVTETDPETQRTLFGRLGTRRAAPPAPEDHEQNTPAVVVVPDPEPAIEVAEAVSEREPRRSRWPFGRERSSNAEASGGTTASSEGLDIQMELDTMAPANDTAVYRLRPGDALVVHLRGIPEPANYELHIDDAGFINLPYIDRIEASGKTASELQRTIENAYIDGQIYQRITINILLPAQSYFVRGEVRQPGRYPLSPGMTMLKAIATAGGYTEFANPRRVNVVRRGNPFNVNARDLERTPELDVEVEPGDVIVVPRSFF